MQLLGKHPIRPAAPPQSAEYLEGEQRNEAAEQQPQRRIPPAVERVFTQGRLSAPARPGIPAPAVERLRSNRGMAATCELK